MAERSPAQPAVVLGLTFLLVGLTFALPVTLVPASERFGVTQYLSAETGNVYACAAWAGWAHFLYAFRGQRNALASNHDGLRTGRTLAYVFLVALSVAVLVAVRWAAGPALFGAVVWVYFIDHFIKAEQSFEGKRPAHSSILVRWASSYKPLLTFAWLSAVLLDIGGVDSHPWTLWTVSLSLGGLVLLLGGWRDLTSGDARGALLSLFFVAEALVWGAFSSYGGPMFLTGVYVFHIAAGSYFHYLGSYFFASARAKGRDRFVTPLAIVMVNAAIIALGYGSANFEGLAWLEPVLGIQWFTLWVALHLVTSDIFPMIKAWRVGGVTPSATSPGRRR